MHRPLRVGLTGGIASGKSTVSQRFVELGVPLIDADVAARLVVGRGKPGLQQIVARFGGHMLDAHGELDRARLRAVVFQDAHLRRELESITHPLIRLEMETQASAASGPYIVFAIPLLIEAGHAAQRVDRVLVVDVDESTQLRRLMCRDGSSQAEAAAILAAQASRAERLAAADDVLMNDQTVSELRQSVDKLHEKYLQLSASSQ